MDHSVVLW